MRDIDKDLLTIQEARIAIENAKAATLNLAHYTQSNLVEIVEYLLDQINNQKLTLVEKMVKETRSGVATDELTLVNLFLERFRQEYLNQDYIGVLSNDSDTQSLKVGMPLGVVVAILPPVPTVALILNLTLISMLSGNSLIVLVSHKASKTTREIVAILDTLAQTKGWPAGALICIQDASNSAKKVAFEHPDVACIVNVGSPESLTESRVPIIYGGLGANPVFIERTANIPQAVADIMQSRCFNNGLLPGSEQFLIVESVILKQVTEELQKQAAYLMNETENQQLLKLFVDCSPQVLNEFSGKSAEWLAKKAGFSVPATTRLLVSVQDYIFDEEPFTKLELSCPILALYQEPDWLHACEKCLKILSEQKKGHTLAIHSTDIKVIKEFIIKKPVARIVVNGPMSFVATGLMSTLKPSLILGGKTTGRGITAANLSPKELTYERNVGFYLSR